MPTERGVVSRTKSIDACGAYFASHCGIRQIFIPAMRGVWTTAKEVFFMEKLRTLFVDSWQELKHVKTLVMTAMFIAMGVVLGFFFSIQITDSLRLGFSFIANEMTALLFGPVVGGIMGGITDILKFIIKPTGPFNFGFTFNAILGAVIYGLILYKRPISFKRILVAKIIVSVVVNMFFGTLWLSVMYGKGFIVLLPPRILKQFIFVPIESFIFYLVAKTLSETKVLRMMKVKSK